MSEAEVEEKKPPPQCDAKMIHAERCKEPPCRGHRCSKEYGHGGDCDFGDVTHPPEEDHG